jgi:hypothetical protein
LAWTVSIINLKHIVLPSFGYKFYPQPEKQTEEMNVVTLARDIKVASLALRSSAIRISFELYIDRLRCQHQANRRTKFGLQIRPTARETRHERPIVAVGRDARDGLDKRWEKPSA